MSKQVWQCEKCFRIHQSEEESRDCEAIHLQPISYRVISWNQHSRAFPEIIQVKMPLQFEHDYATYELKQIGPKGV